MSPVLEKLIVDWQAEAKTLRERFGLEDLARNTESHAEDLRNALQAMFTEVLTLDQAAHRSGYSKAHLRALLANGTLAQAGRKGAPRIYAGQLPIKPGYVPSDEPVEEVEEVRRSNRRKW